jgi:hypothetical protein
MLKEEIVVGKAYVNEGASMIREVFEEVDRRHVKYHAFELGSGRLLPARRQVCDRRELARWADREAKFDEIARIHPFEQRAAVDMALPQEHGTLRVDEARTAMDESPGAHTFPRTK